MPLRNSQTTYGGIAKSLHWITALLVLTVIPLGVIAYQLPYDTAEELARKAWLFSLHKTLGIVVFFVALLRILWALSQPKPALLHPERKIETLAAETAHWLLYGSLVVAPLSGWIHHAATTGFAPIWWPFGQDLPLVPKSEAVAAVTGGLHWVFTKVMAATLLLHIAGALKHHVIDKDATLRRMLPGTPPLPDLQKGHHSKKPIVVAVGIWALALAGGALLGVYQPHGTERAEAAALQEVSSGWEVQEGTIEITVTQFGSEVTGRFADWTAAINFDPVVSVGQAGTVDAVISIGSLTLGSVTDQAMGPDFFDAGGFPTANFVGDISVAADGYEATGTLTLKGKSMPLSFPFGLTVSDGSAEMLGRFTLDRRDFGIGDNIDDESSLNFAVDVVIRLAAARNGT